MKPFEDVNNTIKEDTNDHISVKQHEDKYNKNYAHAETKYFDAGCSDMREAVGLFQFTGNTDKLQHHLVGVLLNQMSAKAGTRKKGERAREALVTEFLQLHDVDVFTAVFARHLSKQQRRSVLIAISVIKEKRNGDLKGRICVDGRG